MMTKKEYPILEFDESKEAFIKPSDIVKPVDAPERCVLCFFAEAVEKILSEYPHKIIGHFGGEALDLPIYELEYKGGKIALALAGMGAPLAAAQIEEITALGCKKFLACGSCGVLRQDIAAGHLIIPVSAVRDEGASYHYVKPSREICANDKAVACIEETIKEYGLPYIKAKTWTTDALYRETPAKIAQRKEEGCVTVEMEASAYMAVSQYNHVELGQILYAGDSLGGDTWDSRDFNNLTDIREIVLRISMDACLKM